MLNKLITYDTLRNFCYVNDGICKLPIKGIVLEFFGLGGATMYHEDSERAEKYAEKGILLVVPYNNPWAWMNRQAIDYTDEIIDVLFDKYSLSDDLPIVASGGSMGGLSALVYTRYSKRTPTACVTNCPVCDLVYHFGERPDLPRTLYSAFWNEQGDISEVLRRYSPYHLAESMPKIKYYQFHCTADNAVKKEEHSDRFVEKMRTLGYDITYDTVPDMGHCNLTSEAAAAYSKYIFDSILK